MSTVLWPAKRSWDKSQRSTTSINKSLDYLVSCKKEAITIFSFASFFFSFLLLGMHFCPFMVIDRPANLQENAEGKVYCCTLNTIIFFPLAYFIPIVEHISAFWFHNFSANLTAKNVDQFLFICLFKKKKSLLTRKYKSVCFLGLNTARWRSEFELRLPHNQ